MKKHLNISALLIALFLFACSSDSGTGTNTSIDNPENNFQEDNSQVNNSQVDNSACLAMAEKYLPIPNSLPEMFTTSLNWVPNDNSSCISKVWLDSLPKSYDTYYQALVGRNWGELIGNDIPVEVRKRVNSEKYMYYKYKEEGGYKVVFHMWLSKREQGGFYFNATFSKIGGSANNLANPYSTDIEYIAKTHTNGIFSSSYIANLAYKTFRAYPVDKSMVDYVTYDSYDLISLLQANGWGNIYNPTCSIADIVNDGISVAGNTQISECSEVQGSMVYDNKYYYLSVRFISNAGTQTRFVYLNSLYGSSP